MLNLNSLRHTTNKILVLGNHEPLIQSILDFDYLSGKQEGSVIGIVTGRAGFAKYFFGRGEVLIQTFAIISDAVAQWHSDTANYWFLNLLSGRRTLSSTQELLKAQTSKLEAPFVGGALFAEGVPELHSLSIRGTVSPWHCVIGPASVGLLIPLVLKLGPIGGITPTQIEESQLIKPGHLAVFSASGGMTNELINVAIAAGHHLSFALSFGGDRFPTLSPRDAFSLAEADPETSAILYYGELGGEDEYDLIDLIKQGKLTKPVIAHIAGTVASLFPESPQFGHAKAKADNARVTAIAKREALAAVGVQVSSSFADFVDLVNKLKY